MEFGAGADADNAESIANPSGNQWTCAVVTTDNDAEAAVVFSIGFTDTAGIAGTAVTATTDGTSVTHDDTVPTLTNIVESVNGAGNGNNGDTVTLTITPSEAIQQPVCTFQSGGANMAASPSYGTGSGNIRTCSILVADGDTNGAVTFSVAYEDSAGNAGVADTTPNSGAVTIDNTHPTMTPVSIAVDNTGDANDGDDITLSFTTSEGIQTPTCTFTSGGAAMADSSITVAEGDNNAWTCVLDVANGDTDGTVAFSIAFTDDAGNAGTAVSAVTDVTAVTVDNTHPTLSTPAITVNGDGNANNADTVTLTFTSSNDVTTAPTCAFTDGGSNAMDAGTSTASGNAAGWTCTVAVGDADVTGAMG
jgi:hypothetical protein